MKIVMYPEVDDARMARIQAVANEAHFANCSTEEAAVEQMPDADGFFGKMTPEILSASKKLSWIQSPTASLEHYLFPELIEHPCEISNMRGIFGDVIASQVLGYILCFSRNLHLYLRQQIEANWSPIGGEDSRTSFHTGPGNISAMDRAHFNIAGKTLGVIGLGGIGKAIVNTGSKMGMDTIGLDPAPKDLPDCLTQVFGMDGLSDLLQQSDFVVIAAPHTPQTEGLFQHQQFKQMKPSAYFINIGRGAIVGLDALCDAIETQQIAGAALDVYEIEPLPKDHRLWAYHNVILTPHTAACCTEVPERHLEVLVDNIRRFASGERPTNIVNKQMWC